MRLKELYLISISIIFLTAISCQKPQCNCERSRQEFLKIDSFYNEHKDISKSLNEFWDRYKEPNLIELESECYRLGVKIVFADYFKIYRLDKSRWKFNLTIKEYAVQTTRYREDSLMSIRTIPINKQQWDTVKKSITDNCFWTIYNVEEESYLDGDSWIIESFVPNGNSCTGLNYHFASRVDLDQDRYKNIAQEFIKFDTIDWANIYDFVPEVN